MWNQRIVPPNRILASNISAFHGGLNNHSILTAPHEASEIMNMTYYDKIILEKRKGSTLFSPTLHTETITHLDEFKPYTEANQMVRAGNSTIRFEDGAILRDYALSGSVGVDGENFQGKYFFVDGNTLRVYGKFPQATSAPYISVIGTPNPDNTVFTVVSTPAGYTPLDTSHTRGVNVYNYTTMTTWYEPCTNEKNDPYLGVSVVPTGIRYIATLRGRIFVSGNQADDDNVFISQTGNPYYFPPSLPIQIPPNSDKITGLVVYDDSVVIGRQNDIHIITGRTNNPDLGVDMFRLQKLNTHTGFISNKSATVAHNYLFFVGFDGNCYALSSARQDAKILATSILNRTLDFKLPPYNLGDSDLSSSVSHFHDGIWYVSIQNYVFCYHYENQAWTVYNNLYARAFYNKDTTMLWGNTYYQTCKWSTDDYLDQNATSVRHPFSSYWVSGLIDFGDAIHFKHMRTLYIVAHSYEGEISDIRISYILDSVNVNNGDLFSLSSARWGIATFGQSFSQNPIHASNPFTIGQRARTIRVKLVNSYDTKGSLANYSDLSGLVNPKKDDMWYIISDAKYYRYTGTAWVEQVMSSLDQPMRIYQVNFEYEFRGLR